MGNRNNGGDGGALILLAIIAVVGVIAYVVWQFSTLVGLDMSTGASVMGRLVVVAILAILSWKFGRDIEFFRLGNVWPILLGLAWFSWWPGLDYWAIHTEPRFSLYDEDVTVWWNAWYTEFGLFFAFIGGGYLGKKLFSNF
jgi:hypothetical protein